MTGRPLVYQVYLEKKKLCKNIFLDFFIHFEIFYDIKMF
jgi:hypothetical protein